MPLRHVAGKGVCRRGEAEVCVWKKRKGEGSIEVLGNGDRGGKADREHRG